MTMVSIVVGVMGTLLLIVSMSESKQREQNKRMSAKLWQYDVDINILSEYILDDSDMSSNGEVLRIMAERQPEDRTVIEALDIWNRDAHCGPENT